MIKLKEIRKKKQYTQEQVAKLLNVHNSMISNFESGKSLPNSEQIIRICKAMNCTADYLLGLIDIEDDEKEKER